MNIKIIKGKNVFKKSRRTLKDNRNKSFPNIYILLCGMFLIGIIAGTLYFKNNIDDDFLKINNYYFQDLKKMDIEKEDVFLDSMAQNLLKIAFFWIVGLSIVGFPILILYGVYEGFAVSLSISYMITFLGFIKGYSYIYITMYIITLINFISILILSVNAIKVTFNILKRNRDVKSEFLRYSGICIIMLVVSILSSFIETYMVEIGKKIILN